MAGNAADVRIGTALAAIAAMALVTYGARLGGLLLMHYVPPTPRVSAFLKHLSGSVLAALVVPAVVRGDVSAWVAIAVTAALARARRPMLAIAAGMAIAALLRTFR